MSASGACAAWPLLLAMVMVVVVVNVPPLLPMLPLSPFPAAAAELVPVEGRVERLQGDQLPGAGPGPRFGPQPAPNRQVVAIAGTLPAGGQPLWANPLPAGRLLGQARTDAGGRFRLLLPPGVVTLLVEVPGGYWLNSFDGQGNFTAVQVRPGLAPVRLIDDRGALF